MPGKNVKEQVLAQLASRRGRYCSGQELADELQVTRAAVWKAITALREEGFAIDAVTNRGYALSPDADVLSAKGICGALPPDVRAALRVETSPCVPSTNTVLRERAAGGAPEGLVLAAREQTAGRGRMGRGFYSPAGSGLYLSILLRPALAAAEAVQLTAAAAVAAARAAETVRQTPGAVRIKWVNDLLLDGRKICGILTEAQLSLESGGLDYAVLGVGFNLTPPAGGWPAELDGIAGSLFDGPAPPGARTALAAAFLAEFWPLYRALAARPFLAEYRERQAVLGRRVEVWQGAQPPRAAQALAIDDACRLVVRYEDDGTAAALPGGEVRVRV